MSPLSFSRSRRTCLGSAPASLAICLFGLSGSSSLDNARASRLLIGPDHIRGAILLLRKLRLRISGVLFLPASRISFAVAAGDFRWRVVATLSGLSDGLLIDAEIDRRLARRSPQAWLIAT